MIRPSKTIPILLLCVLTGSGSALAQDPDLNADGLLDSGGTTPPPRGSTPTSITASPGELIAVDWDVVDSPVWSIDLPNGTPTIIGYAGFTRLNSLARDDEGILYSAGSPFVEEGGLPAETLIEIDPFTGDGTLVTQLAFPGTDADVRAMAFSPGNVLYALHHRPPPGVVGPPHDLYVIDIGTGAGTLVGETVASSQSLAFSPDGVLYAYDRIDGLVTLDPSTGAATDVNPAVGGEIENFMQTLFFDGDELFGLNPSGVWSLDRSSGEAALIVEVPNDWRGAELLVAQCDVDADCDDGLFCNGQEYCDSSLCRDGAPPCPPPFCDESEDTCEGVIAPVVTPLGIVVMALLLLAVGSILFRRLLS